MISYFVIAMLAISIIVVMVLTLKFKVHPFIAMLVVAIFLAFTLHVPANKDTNYITEISALIGKGFGNALANVGIIIILGSIIGNILEMSGAALKLGEIVICKYTKLEDKNVVVIESQDEKVLHAMIALSDKK